MDRETSSPTQTDAPDNGRRPLLRLRTLASKIPDFLDRLWGVISFVVAVAVGLWLLNYAPLWTREYGSCVARLREPDTLVEAVGSRVECLGAALKAINKRAASRAGGARGVLRPEEERILERILQDIEPSRKR
jgi:hypothetical protein